MSDYKFNEKAEVIDEKAIAWKEARLGRFTSSSIAKLLVKDKAGDFGEAALTYIYKKCAETITLEYNEISSAAIKWGEEHEKDAVLSYGKMFEKEIEYYGKENPVFINYGNHAGGSPDGYVITDKATLEVKCPFESGNHMETYHKIKMGKFDLKKWDKEYYGQCQFNMYLQKAECAKFVSYDPRVIDYRYSVAEFTVERNEEYITELLERIKKAVEVKKQYLTDLGYYEEEAITIAA